MKIEEKMRNALEATSPTLVGDVLLVSRIKLPEPKSEGGLVLASSSITGHKQLTGFDANKPIFLKVLAVGKGFYDDVSGKDVPLDVKVGNIIEVGANSVVFFSSFGNIVDNAESGTGVGITREAEVRIKFSSQEEFEKFLGFF
jgi:co-chaperonin GroES (HSP10)